MKRVVLIGIVLAIFILAMPQGVSAETKTDPVTINAKYEIPLAFSADANMAAPAIWPWVLSAGSYNQNPDALVFKVKAGTDWTVTATDTSGYSDGYMQGDVTHLQNPFLMERNNDNSGQNIFKVTTVGPIVLSGGQWFAERTFYSDIWQQVVNDDYASPGGYHITITFDCSASF